MGRRLQTMLDWFDSRALLRVEKGSTSFTARDIAGATGWVRSNAWDKIAEGSDAYAKSFAPHIPPSLHISHRDATRHNIPIPVPERCLEDFGPQAAPVEEPGEPQPAD